MWYNTISGSDLSIMKISYCYLVNKLSAHLLKTTFTFQQLPSSLQRVWKESDLHFNQLTDGMLCFVLSQLIMLFTRLTIQFSAVIYLL